MVNQGAKWSHVGKAFESCIGGWAAKLLDRYLVLLSMLKFTVFDADGTTEILLEGSDTQRLAGITRGGPTPRPTRSASTCSSPSMLPRMICFINATSASSIDLSCMVTG